jgi:hypothetical protein
MSPRRKPRRSWLRPLFLEGEDRVEFIEVSDELERLAASRIFDVQWDFIEGKATTDDLAKIARQKITGRTVQADPLRLALIADRGEADLPEAYKEALG